MHSEYTTVEILIRYLHSDYWSFDESVYFYKNALEVEKEEGFEGIVCHETHRNRSLFNPYSTDYIVQRVPQYVNLGFTLSQLDTDCTDYVSLPTSHIG